MRAIAPLLLCLLSALVEVHSHPFSIYVSFMGDNLLNHSYVDLTAVGNYNSSSRVQCHTDLISCCNRTHGINRGDWYFPNGSRLQFNGDPGDIFEQRVAKRVDLRRRNDGDTSGIYRCDSETFHNHIHDESDNTTRETVYVGLYASGGEHIHACGPLPGSVNFTYSYVSVHMADMVSGQRAHSHTIISIHDSYASHTLSEAVSELAGEI